MSRPTPEQVVFVSTQVTAALLEIATDEGHDETILRSLRRWFPDKDQVDDYTLRSIARTVRANMVGHRTLLLDRLDRLVAKGQAKPL